MASRKTVRRDYLLDYLTMVLPLRMRAMTEQEKAAFVLRLALRHADPMTDPELFEWIKSMAEACVE